MNRNGTRLMREIMLQPHSLESTLGCQKGRVRSFARYILRNGIGEMDAVGSGSSLNAALIGKSALRGISLRPCEPSSYQANAKIALFVSQSGESGDVLEAQERARGRERLTVALTNDWKSALAVRSDMVIPTFAENEACVPATGTMLSALLTFFHLGAELSGRKGDWEALQRIPARLGIFLRSREIGDGIGRIAHGMEGVALAAFLGEGRHRHAASEIALKVSETAEIIAMHEGTAMFRHGRLAPFLAQTPPLSELKKAVVILSCGNGNAAMVYSALDRGNSTVYEVFHGAQTANGSALALGAQDPLEEAVFAIAFGQLLAHELALAKGMPQPGTGQALPKIVK